MPFIAVLGHRLNIPARASATQLSDLLKIIPVVAEALAGMFQGFVFTCFPKYHAAVALREINRTEGKEPRG